MKNFKDLTRALKGVGNAVSGIADVVETIPAKYELIDTIVTEEDVSEIEFDDINLKKCVIVIDFHDLISSASYLTPYINTQQLSQISVAPGSSTYNYKFIKVDTTAIMDEVTYVAPNAYSNRMSGTISASYNGSIPMFTSDVTSIKLAMATIPAGTTITLYGM